MNKFLPVKFLTCCQLLPSSSSLSAMELGNIYLFVLDKSPYKTSIDLSVLLPLIMHKTQSNNPIGVVSRVIQYETRRTLRRDTNIWLNWSLDYAYNQKLDSNATYKGCL